MKTDPDPKEEAMKKIEIRDAKRYRAWTDRLILAGYRIASIGPEGTVMSRKEDPERILLAAGKED